MTQMEHVEGWRNFETWTEGQEREEGLLLSRFPVPCSLALLLEAVHVVLDLDLVVELIVSQSWGQEEEGGLLL